ncbi:thioesterase II family protein [Segniliparus rugosus]|uniref:Thioesterase TesA n=1 Tax=Segniliparus rugosus (strain ATCC BAA-974 / DSM 45345 / CCUG 50838 / CIP 108380 / JCM 13579 / CDC 945) TaxID=679197 RepID=E5XLS6_SEGRC|nr:alpha/beta fold hydrolase [Segniliparus rugosus]EFV14754.1 hypothetical protein HMPREF9336_00445 [Segniliparus rugosus ATCC BAA-974]
MALTRHPQGWVRQFHRPADPNNPLLLVFPHAGAGASAYRALSKALSERFDVVIFQYPGRQDRAGEPALLSLPEIAAGAFEDFQAAGHRPGAPIMTFGHSMGGLVSFEFARLAQERGVAVPQLVVSAAIAPCRAAEKPSHPTGDEEILDHLGRLEGTDTAIFANRDLMRAALPAIKGDYQAFDAYSCAEGVKVSSRVHVLGGDADPVVTMRDLYDWDKHADDVQVTVFSGGHFYLNEHMDALSRLLVEAAQGQQAGTGAAR